MKEIIPIIILNYNTSNHVKENIESVIKYENNENLLFKFIVIDNRSSENDRSSLEDSISKYETISITLKDKYDFDCKIYSLDLLKLKEAKVIYVKMEENFGFSYSNNIGLKIAKKINSKYCIISNPDTRIIDEKSINNLYQTMESDELVGMAFPKVIDVNGKHQEIYYKINLYSLFIYNVFYPLLYIPTKLWRIISNVINTHYNYTDIYTSIGCFFMVRISDMEKVNYMDENIFMYYEEDIMSIKFKNINKKLVCVNDSIILHKHIITRQQENIEMKNRSLVYFLKEYLNYTDIKIRLCKFGIKFMNQVYAPIIDKINKC